jgi:hypothetical protein
VAARAQVELTSQVGSALRCARTSAQTPSAGIRPARLMRALPRARAPRVRVPHSSAAAADASAEFRDWSPRLVAWPPRA